MRHVSFILPVLGLFACNGDKASDTGATDTPADADTDADSDTDVDSDSDSDTDTVATQPEPDSWVGLIRGSLAEPDIADAQAYHDGVAAYGEPGAKAAGDVGHEAFLGTTHLGGIAGTFMALDEWTDPAGEAALYADPAFAGALGGLFSAPPDVEQFGHEPGWYQWGTLDAGDAGESHYFVVVRGRLIGPTYAESQTAHDAVAGYGEAGASYLGDLGHQVYLGTDDWREFLAIDVWADDTNIDALYSDPAFQAAFATLFDGEPSVTVYESTDWYGW